MKRSSADKRLYLVDLGARYWYGKELATRDGFLSIADFGFRFCYWF
jgi:hypothetical protein